MIETRSPKNFNSSKNHSKKIVLGLHREPWHDTGAALIVEDDSTVKLVSISQERLDRIKHSRAYPKEAIEYCMKELNVGSINEIDLVVADYICFPIWNRDYDYNPKNNYHPLLNGVPQSNHKDQFEFPAEKIAVINHHRAHAASAFYASGFEESAVLIIDGNGSEMETQSLFYASRKDGIRLIEKSYSIGLGQLYSSITAKIGFGILNEGKTMGLAPYGKDAVSNSENIIDWSTKKYDGINTDYSSICNWQYEILATLPEIDEKIKSRIAYEVQRETEEGMVHLASHAKKVTNSKNLCIGGGVGLNSISNYEILKRKLFDDIFIQPACSDTGIPLGCAFHGFYEILKRKSVYTFENALLGRNYSNSEIESEIKTFSGCIVSGQNIIDETINLLTQNKVVGWFQGRSETGPRALGSRSILMSPCKAKNKDILNIQVKHREPFRPFAPAVLEEKASDYFDLDTSSPYMLLIADVKEEAQKILPAITHIDGTARVQTVNSGSNKTFYNLIKGFGEKTGVYVLLNTSFNDNNEPIVETPKDAVRCFLKTGIDALCIGDFLLIKNEYSEERRNIAADNNFIKDPISLEYAEELIEKKEYGKARSVLVELLKKDDRRNLDILNDLAVIDILEKKFHSGLNVLNRILEIDPQNEVAKGNLEFIAGVKN